MHADDSARLSGRLLDGRYRIGARIARGGMASVYEAVDTRLERPVAVKVMHPGLGDDEEFAARFVREARHAARLSHPHVVGVTDQGEDDGTVFLVMEYVPGHTLRDVIRKESPMTPQRALDLVEPMLSALAAAHRAHLIHRDIKPENVLIAAEGTPFAGQVKVADFGLAKAVSADTQHTVTGGVLIGTVSYLAPELVVESRADERADVYAVGVVLYELLTGTKPHEGESPIQVAYKHVHADVPPPSSVVPGIPDFVDALVQRATARDREQRPADASVMLHQVHRVAQALREGVTSDPELAEDLRPRRVLVEPQLDDTEADPFDGAEPEVFDPLSLVAATAASDAAQREPAPEPVDHREHTTALDTAPPPPIDDSPRDVRPAGASVVRRPRRSKRGPIALLLALLLAVGVGVGAWWFGWERWTQTPGVLRMTQAEATQRLADDGLDADIADKAFSETVPAGEVISSDPAPGERVLDGGTVTLVLSLGKERYDVPRLRGLTEDAAQQRLTQSHLAAGESREVYHEQVPSGQVIGTDPKPGTTVKPGTEVDLLISKGQKPIPVGDWTGKSAERATAALEKRGLSVETSEEFSDDVAEGRVISQDPATGTLVRGETVSLVVSRGPELVQVPGGIVASGVEDATQRLEDAGFTVQIEHDSNYLGLGYVFKMSPSSGDMVPRGSTITLTLI